MKRIYKNNDLVFNLTINDFPINKDLINSIEFRFYTLDNSNYITKNSNDIDEYNQVILQWDELKKLEEGVLYYDYTVSLNNDDMVDKTLDNVSKRMTNYYLCSNVHYTDNMGESYYTKDEVDDLINDVVVGTIDLSNYYDKTEVDNLINNIDIPQDVDLSDYYTKNEVDNKIPKDYLTTIPSEYVTDSELTAKGYLTEHQSLDNYYKKTETYSKSEVNTLIDGLSTNDGEINLTNYYTKTEVDNLIPTDYITTIPSEYITETELKAKGYLTEHQSLNDYYKKSEIDTKLKGYSTSSHTHSQYLTEHQSLSGYAKLTDIPTDYVTEAKLNSKGYLTAVPSEYITETELEAKGYLTAVPSQYITEAELESKDYLSVIPSEYITETELDRKGYLTEHQSLENYYSKSEVNALIDGVSAGNVELTNYYTKNEVNDLIDSISVSGDNSNVDLTDYYTKSEIDTIMLDNHISDIFVHEGKLIGANISGNWRNEVSFATINGQKIIGNNTNIEVQGNTTDLTDYYTKSETYSQSEVNALIDGVSAGDVDLTNYYTKSEVNNLIPTDYITSIPSEYITETELTNNLKGYALSSHTHNYLTSIPSEYVTESELSAKGYLTEHQSLDNYYTKADVDNKISTSGNFDSTQYYTKTEVNELIPSEYIKAFNIGRQDDENFQVDDGVVNIYNQMYDGGYEVAVDGTSIFGIKPIDNSIVIENAGGTGNGNFRCGIKVNTDILSSYDDTALANRVSALETELNGVSEQITELNNMVV